VNNNLIEFPTSGKAAILHEPLRRFAPTSRAVAKCKRDLSTDQLPLSRKEMHERQLSRVEEVLSAAQLLDEIMNGGNVIPPDLILDMLETLQFTISTQKKSEQETAVSALSGIALFDFDVDSAGADLGHMERNSPTPDDRGFGCPCFDHQGHVQSVAG
jgi:hypothetical protein